VQRLRSDSGLPGAGPAAAGSDWGKMVAEGRMWIITASGWLLYLHAISSLVVGPELVCGWREYCEQKVQLVGPGRSSF
jgi:hypothetical protein